MKNYCVWKRDAGHHYWLLAPSKKRARELVISNIKDFPHSGDDVECEVDDKHCVPDGVILRSDGHTFTILNV